jgi:hypothetical protein
MLVVDTSGDGVRTAIVRPFGEGGGAEIVSEAQGDALESTLDALGEPGGIPSRAVLISPQVVSAVLYLPMDPSSPRDEAEMRELVRWELEPFLAANEALENDDWCYAYKASGGEADQTGMHPWIASGISRRMRDEWSSRFASLGISLETIYPTDVPEEFPRSHAAEESDRYKRVMEVARQAFGSETEREEVCIPAQDQRRRLWRRPAAWVAAASLAVLVGLGWTEASLALQMRSAQALWAEMSASSESPPFGAGATQLRGESQRLRTLLAEQQKELSQLQEVRQVAERELPRCTGLLTNLLDALTDAVSEELVLERVALAEGNTVAVSAWSLSQPVAQRFGRQLMLDDRLSDLELVENNVRAGKGRLGLDGYSVGLRFIGSAEHKSEAISVALRGL